MTLLALLVLFMPAYSCIVRENVSALKMLREMPLSPAHLIPPSNCPLLSHAIANLQENYKRHFIIVNYLDINCNRNIIE